MVSGSIGARQKRRKKQIKQSNSSNSFARQKSNKKLEVDETTTIQLIILNSSWKLLQ